MTIIVILNFLELNGITLDFWRIKESQKISNMFQPHFKEIKYCDEILWDLTKILHIFLI